MEIKTVTYRFDLADGSHEVFDLKIGKADMHIIREKNWQFPSWTDLEFHRCPNCPVDDERFSFCPVAANLVPIVERLDRLLSYDDIGLCVETEERQIIKKTSAQRGISSLMGLLIAVSECPLTDFFKPMAHFHLPVANREETIWRAASMYYLAQYFLYTKGYDMDLSLKGLSHLYDRIEQLNMAMLQRLRSVSKRDSAINALIHLDVFAKYLAPSVEESLKKVEHILTPLISALTDPS